MLLKKILIGLIVFLLLELASIVLLSFAIGFGWVLVLLIVSFLIGSYIKHKQGDALSSWQRQLFAQDINANRPFKGHLSVIAVLLMSPGFLSDLIALFMCIPAFRTYLIYVLVKKFSVPPQAAPFSPKRTTAANSQHKEGVTIDGEYDVTEHEKHKPTGIKHHNEDDA